MDYMMQDVQISYGLLDDITERKAQNCWWSRLPKSLLTAVLPYSVTDCNHRE